MARKRIRGLTNLASLGSGGYYVVVDPPTTGDARKVLDTVFRDFVQEGVYTTAETDTAIAAAISAVLDGVTFTGDVVVPSEIYGAGWNGSNEVPTKNDIYDKIEAVVAGTPGTFTTEDAQDATGAMVDGTLTYTDATPLLRVTQETKAADIASASTVNIGAAVGGFMHVTGTTTITAFDSVTAGTERTLKFDGILTLTHNATSLILPGGANITTAAGDTAIFRSEGSGNWRCISYNPASGAAVAGSAGAGWVVLGTTTGSSTTITWNSISQAYRHLKIIGEARSTGTGSGVDGLQMRLNNDSGTNYPEKYHFTNGVSNTVNSSTTNTSIQVGEIPKASNYTNGLCSFEVTIFNYTNSSGIKTIHAHYTTFGNAFFSDFFTIRRDGLWIATPAAVTRIDLLDGFTWSQGSAVLYGIP